MCEHCNIANEVIEQQIRREIEEAGPALHIEVVPESIPPWADVKVLEEHALRLWALAKVSMNARFN